VSRPLRADAARNRERLLAVASEAVARDGIDASLEDIAKTAGVGIGTLYRHFPTRDALLEAVFRHNVAALCDGGRRLLDTLPADQALAEWMQRFVAYVATKRGLAGHLKSVVAKDSELFVESHAMLRSTMETLLAAAVRDGAVRPDVDPLDLLRAMSGVCMAGDAPGWEEQACRITRLLVDGLRYRPAGASA
jgi:AcrR family transcriptional regulator